MQSAAAIRPLEYRLSSVLLLLLLWQNRRAAGRSTGRQPRGESCRKQCGESCLRVRPGTVTSSARGERSDSRPSAGAILYFSTLHLTTPFTLRWGFLLVHRCSMTRPVDVVFSECCTTKQICCGVTAQWLQSLSSAIQNIQVTLGALQ
jgi:hypothetical protein